MTDDETPIQEARRIAEERLAELHLPRRIAEAAYDDFQTFLGEQQRLLRMFGDNLALSADGDASWTFWARTIGGWRGVKLT